MANGLTLRQERLVDALADPSVTSLTAAAVKAGYPPRSAAQRGHEAVKSRDVQAAIAARKAVHLDKAKENTDRVLRLGSTILDKLEKEVAAADCDTLVAAQTSGIVARTAKEIREGFGESSAAATVSTKERILKRRLLLRAAYLAAKRQVRLETIASRIAELDLLLSHLS